MNLLTVTMFGVGAIFIRAAIKDMSPKDVVLEAFGTTKTATKSPNFRGKPVTPVTDMTDIPVAPYPVTSV